MLATNANLATFGNVGIDPWEQEEFNQASAIRNMRGAKPTVKGRRSLRVKMNMRRTKVATNGVIARHRNEKLGFGA